ncbi:MAG: hypothetical protein QME40_04040 [bacterium]|nr:hypothetical protein [bacterium]
MKSKKELLWDYIFELYNVKNYDELKKKLDIKIKMDLSKSYRHFRHRMNK